MQTMLAQAAAEYVGVTLRTAMRSVGTGMQSTANYMRDNPVVMAVAILGLLILVRLMTRKRR
ncbi:MAG: hypothetical protein OEU54_03965 [Gemmatimonadota bacterium]|nr:hypothetical protein [Gemmatimonadota bacterium]